MSDLERTLLPEWFDGSAAHRTPERYVQTRQYILSMAKKLGKKFVTITLVRRSIAGDVGSLMRLHKFLTLYGFINSDESMNESAPLPTVIQKASLAKKKRAWNDGIRSTLLQAVVDESRRKRTKLNDDLTDSAVINDDDSQSFSLNWEAVAKVVGGCTAQECEAEFLSMSIAADQTPVDRSITPDSSVHTNVQPVGDDNGLNTRRQVVQEIIAQSDPAIVAAVVNAACQLTVPSDDGESNNDAQGAEFMRSVHNNSAAGLALSQAIIEAQKHESRVARIMSEIVDLRMQKLENRLSVLNEVEGMLEAERVSLELERRDLFTTRCRHWFGSS